MGSLTDPNMELNKSSYKIRKDEQSHISLEIVEARCQAEGLHLATWSSAWILSNRLHTLQIDQAQLQSAEYSVVELGAGTGLTGLTAAAIWKTKSLLTDLPTIVPGLQENISLNFESIEKVGGSASCGTLDWNSPDTVHLHDSTTGESVKLDAKGAFPIILAADTMYTEDHPQLMSQTILKCLKRSPQARAIVCYAMRVAYIDYMREFWELMEEGGLVADQEGREEIDLKEWDDEKLHEWSAWKWKDL